ncbi:hypothetical protein BDV41DRAFT_566153 [Aspergillus transmontanensis]|uniref:Uncharacterized protein n=1 Tax=Aspergillus transmontanensis TaxID=1034304 RepID=A0A5N6VRB1_9EURO|nr:hypothetical protein BDV41DRAFT_566153 [Aspergillus transmontanensis]
MESNNITKPKLQPQEKRDQRKRGKQAALIEASLKSGKCLLFLQEAPKFKTIQCRAWDCMHRRRTGKPIIRSYYRFALKAMPARSSSIEYYHITCFERILPDLPNLVRYGYLKMDGCIAAPPDSQISIKSSIKAIEDCFIWIEHVLSHEEKPQRSHYFPKEPSLISLSELIASVSGQPHIDKWWLWRNES